MFDFYNMFYPKYLNINELKEACKYKVITDIEYKEITGEEYIKEDIKAV